MVAYFTGMSQDARVTFLNRSAVPRRNGVVYWMQASARTRYNHALEYAVHVANHRSDPLEVVFVLTPGYPGANLRHYWFLVQGLRDVADGLRDRGIPFRVIVGTPPVVVSHIAATVGTIVTDGGYTRVQRQWRDRVAADADCPVVEVESNVVVPVRTVSDKDEWSAATLRRKLHRHLDDFLVPVTTVGYRGPSAPSVLGSLPTDCREIDPADLTRPEDLTSLFELETSVAPVSAFRGGEAAAAERLADFLEHRLRHFDERRNVPDLDWTSHLSPYLHFGHVSPVELVLAAQERVKDPLGDDARGDLDTFVEELVVRRELAMNFVTYNPEYDTFRGLPDWARATLEEHSGDDRPVVYDLDTLEAAATDDPYWNACQREMVQRGVMHGYMRMYWGKKILEWTQNPEEALERAVILNDRYELDGRDPNGYAGVAWCFGKHDRPWVERPVFGKVRYMNANGLKRKFKGIDRYLERWNA